MITTIHETDLFRPHGDPDDHFDLACQYALHKMGRHRLAGIMIDYPPRVRDGRGAQPDVLAVAQMNYLTGSSVPVGIGAPDTEPEAESSGMTLLIDTLRASEDKVTIHIVGSSRDVAAALTRAPELFEEKCAGIYLNAGSGTENGLLEWNVRLDPAAYSAVFSARCPVYWMPCFEKVADGKRGEDMTVGRYGTFYRFTMGEILPKLSHEMQNFFLGMLNRETTSDWLETLERDVDDALLRMFSRMPRNMWCTGGFLHAVGLGVSKDGEIVSKDDENAVYRFTPVRVSCSRDGRTAWHTDEKSDRCIFTVTDPQRYPEAMTKAMCTLLTTL